MLKPCFNPAAVVLALALATAWAPSTSAWGADAPKAVPAKVAVAAQASAVGASPAAAPAAPAVAGAVAAIPAAASSAPAATAAARPATSLDDRVQELKGDVIRLNRDLLVLEEELLFPANTQVALFVSMDVGKLFSLDSVQIKLDDKVVTNYLYTPLEVQALHRGGVQRVYLGNLKAGEHQIVAFFTGQGPPHGEQRRDYKRGATVKFEKGTEPKYIELQIKDSTGKLQPEFDVKVWQ